jgi:hypothetical protein
MYQNWRTSDDEVREKVAIRAYEIYEDRGGQHGRDIDDWLQAESEILSVLQESEFTTRKPPSRTQEITTKPERENTAG